ncbi:MAG: xanthine dehydrogenase family protein molybdopterin-binding subunit [bacterium]|nr:xanthine dehydrogenase family protein molybdopterin-binding subunit [bacterium]
MQIVNMSRRNFLKSATIAGSGLILGFHLPFHSRPANAADADQTEMNAFIRIGQDESVTIMVASSEMGQGIYTALPMIVAEELEADWTKVRAEMAPAQDVYKNPGFQPMPMQATGGSHSIRGWWQPLHKVGASAREMLVAAAAEQWGVAPGECAAENGMVVHKSRGKKLSFGALAEAAARREPPQEPQLKPREQYRIIGQRVKRLDTPSKLNGSAVFGIDVVVPNMLHAAVKACPVFGGEVTAMNEAAAKAVQGVKAVVSIPNGVAVVAESYWQAKKGLNALDVTFNEGEHATLNSARISQIFHEALQEPGAVVHAEGDVEGTLSSAETTIDIEYEVPFLAHATMEPMNCTAHVTADSCEIWAPTQFQDMGKMAAMQITGLPPEKVQLHTTFIGMGLGRRFEADFVVQAVLVSKIVGQPVKVTWSREEDIQHDFYRSAGVSAFRIGLDSNGMPVAWSNKFVGSSILSRVFPQAVQNGIDPTSVNGAREIHYAIPNQSIKYVLKNTNIPVGAWRSVAPSQHAFNIESAIDEIAHAGGRDPYQFRRQLLSAKPRFQAVLDLAAEKAGWGKPLPEGRFQGIAIHKSYGSIVCHVAEVSVSKQGQLLVHRIVSVVDCGEVVNPDTVEAQIESGIIFGLTAALSHEIIIDKGRVSQSNFHDCPALLMKDIPVIEAYFVKNTEAPGGLGEPGVPPVAPAVTNAIFAATGKRLRSLPISKHDLKTA